MIPMEEDLAALARPGWIPLVILIVMFIALFFLWRSMRRMLRTVDPDLPHKADLEAELQAEEGGDGTEESAVERARHGDAPAGVAAGLVAQPPDSEPSDSSRD